MHYRLSTSLLSGVLLLSGCGAATEGGHPGPWSMEYRERTGLATGSDIVMRLPHALARHGYLIEGRERRGDTYYFETQWKLRDPFRDEQRPGVVEARTRVRIRAVRRDDGRMYRVHFTAENMIRTVEAGWVRVAPTDMFEDYARGIAQDVRLEIASGIRRY